MKCTLVSVIQCFELKTLVQKFAIVGCLSESFRQARWHLIPLASFGKFQQLMCFSSLTAHPSWRVADAGTHFGWDQPKRSIKHPTHCDVQRQVPTISLRDISDSVRPTPENVENWDSNWIKSIHQKKIYIALPATRANPFMLVAFPARTPS
jgi:hypothetical protein